MKTQFIIIVSMLLVLTLNAQAQWLLTGNTPGGTDFLGSTNAADLIFKTNGNEVGRFIGVASTNQYYLGIGSATDLLAIIQGLQKQIEQLKIQLAALN